MFAFGDALRDRLGPQCDVSVVQSVKSVFSDHMLECIIAFPSRT
jgi:hypothetical protein